MPPKPGQLEFAAALAEHLSSPDGALLAEGYNGLGKTLASLWALKRSGRRGLIAVRTYEEAGNYYAEAKRLGIRLAVLLSKKSFCTNPRVAGLPQELFYSACLQAYSSGECGDTQIPAPDAPDFPSYVEASRSAGCPFITTVRAAASSEVSVVTYPYALDFSDRLGSLLDRFDAIIYDEAHNLVDRYLEAKVLHPSDLTAIARAWRSEPVKLLAKHTTGSRVARAALEEAAWELSSILGANILVQKDCVVAYSPPKPILRDATAFMSGFIPESTSRILSVFTGVPTKRISAPVPENLKIRVLITEDIDSSYVRRRENAPSYAELVQQFASLPGRKAVFYASKKVMKLVGVPAGAVTPAKVFRPPSSADYLVADVLGGRLSEGSNVPFDAVLIIGFPYLEPTPALRFVLNTIRERYGEDLARSIYEDSALCRVVQAIGRLTRTGGWAILADGRALRYRYPSWIEVEKMSFYAVVDEIKVFSRV